MNISEELNILNTAKQDIKSAIIEKGQTVGDNMHEYADAIKNISGGGEDTNDYLCFEAVEDSFWGMQAPSVPNINIEYSFDKKNWQTLDLEDEVQLLSGQKCYLRGTNIINGQYSLNHQDSGWLKVDATRFTSRGKMNVSGNIMFLLDKTGNNRIIGLRGFGYIFSNYDATSYENTGFYDCSKIVIEADDAGNKAFFRMFEYNQNIIYGPTDIKISNPSGSDVFGFMFRGCTSLIKAMHTLYSTEAKGNEYYHQMFSGCTSLVFAPYIMLKTISGTSCMSYMFRDCVNLQYLKTEFTTTPSSSGGTTGMFNNVTTSGVYIKAKDASWTTKGTYSCPSSWTLITSVS